MAKKFELGTIKDAIIAARQDGNKGAIGDQFVKDGLLTEQALANWKAYIADLRDECITYVKLSESINATDKEIQAAQGKVWAAWRSVLKVGTEKDFDANFFIRSDDAAKLAHWACFTVINSARGKQASVQGLADFQKRVEILIGIRMAGNGILEEDTKDLILAYEGAVKSIKHYTDMLDGYTNSKKEHTEGLREKLDRYEASVKKQTTKLKELNVSDDDIAVFLHELNLAIKTTKGEIKSAEAYLADAKKTEAEKKADYEKAIALLKTVGDRS